MWITVVVVVMVVVVMWMVMVVVMFMRLLSKQKVDQHLLLYAMRFRFVSCTQGKKLLKKSNVLLYI